MNLKFPSRFTFLLVRDIETGNQTVSACVNKTKCQLDNLKFKDVQHFSWKPNERVTTLSVREFDTNEQFEEYLTTLTNWWGC